MAFVARNKPFRSAQAKASKTQAYKQLAALAGPPTYSAGIAAGEKHVAVGYGASKGSVLLLPVDATQYKASSSPFTVAAHASELGDLAWAPFAAGLLATGAADGTVKLWQVPAEGLTANLSTPTLKFDGLDIVHALAWHPSASGVLAVGGKTGLNLFDTESGSTAATRSFGVEGFGKDVTSIRWSRNGSLLSAVGKNASLCVIDPRTAEAGVLAGAAPSTLVKKLQHGVFIGGEGTGAVEHLALFGVSAQQRPVMVWTDPRKPGVAIKTHDFEFSQGYALPIYEPDTHSLYYTIRGSEMISILDVESDKGAPAVWPSHTFSANSAVKGLALLPKRAVDTNACEVNRVFTLGADAVEAYNVTVPRKTAGFHAELFPETTSTSAAHSGAEWLSGGDKAPLKTSMVAIHERGGASGAAALAASAAGLKISSPAPTSSPSPTSASATAASPSSANSASSPAARAGSGSVSSSRPASNSIVSPTNRGASTSVSAVYVPSDMRAKIDSSLKKSVFTHCMGREPASNFQSYFDLSPGVSLPLAENIRSNGSFFAIPWKASGGSALAVFRVAQDALGRAPPTQPCVRGHKFPASSFDFSPFEKDLLASGCVDGTIFLWRIPAGGLKSDLTEPESSLQSQGKVGLVRFHPTVAGILVVATSSFDGAQIEVWDVSKKGNQSEPAFIIPVHPEPEVAIIDFSFHPRGHILAVTARDGKTRLVHLHEKKEIVAWSTPEGVKDTRVLFVGDNRVLTVGFGAGGARSMSLHDTSATPPALLQTLELDRVPYLPLPRFDPDARLLYLANAGGTFIPLYTVNDSAPYIENLNLFQTSCDTVGFVLLPKRAGDVKKVEVQRALKLTKDSVLPISYTVPRKRVEFFQDDLFPPSRKEGPELSAADWIAGKHPGGVEPTKESLQPAGMAPLSEAPEEELTEKQKKYINKLAAEAAPKAVGALGHTSEAEVREHFKAQIGNVGGANRWDARVDNSKVDVDEDEWN